MSSKKSFFFGLLIASIIWAVCLYIYMNALQPFETPTFSPSVEQSFKVPKKYKYENKFKLTNDLNFLNEKVNRKSVYNKYVNSDKLINKLQPVNQNISNSLEEDHLTQLGMVKTEEDRRKRDDGYKNYAFNVLISEAIGYSRPLPDTRNKLCRDKKYPENLPSTSVIICFYNEHLITLLRTIHSILDRTPKHVLHEIILVDDYSDMITLHSDVERYISQNLDDKVKLYKTDRREGLIRARMFGADKATGKVIVFLDSHVEVNTKWLEPLLERIVFSNKIIAVPVIDIINCDTFAYTSSPLVRGGFNWGLHYKWDNLPKGTLDKPEDFIKSIKSPTMAGGLFAMDREYFYTLGAYDRGMNIWGGENIEISFRVWMCGGSLEIVPCSRVGHVFRRRRPYGNPNGVDTMLHNSLRVAHVWMDEYKEHFLNNNPTNRQVSYGDVSDRVNLRKQLNCKSFDWYLKEIYPELELPTDDDERLRQKWSAVEQNKFQPWHLRKRTYVDKFQLRYTNSNLCIGTVKDYKTKGSLLSLQPCKTIPKQLWYETDKKEFVVGQMLCLEASESIPRAMKCHEMGGNQEWKHNGGRDNGPIYNMAVGMCLGVNEAVKEGITVEMVMCSSLFKNQWDILRL